MTPHHAEIIFEECASLFSDRQTTYRDTFQQVPMLLNIMRAGCKKTEHTPESWCIDMALLKLQRFINSGETHRDSLIDAINYICMAVYSIDSYDQTEKQLAELCDEARNERFNAAIRF